MTGHGEAHCQQDGIAVTAEVRTINNRYLKLVVRGGEGYTALEPQIESLVRAHVRRGTVQVGLRIQREPSPDDYKLNQVVLGSYRRQLEALYDKLHVADSIHLELLLSLPGVIDERATQNVDLQADWPVVERALNEALEHLAKMRIEEGRAMEADLKTNCDTVTSELNDIEKLAPAVVDNYRQRLRERLNKWLAEFDLQVDEADLLREVSLFSERSDISEEIVRLRSHLEQFGAIMSGEESNGRKLEFLTQEMFRETNTIGSKANDAEIARRVIEIKTAIERMREMIQNVE